MSYTCEEREKIYDKTNGYCYYCGKKLAFTNYGIHGAKGAWEVEHSNPKSQAGTEYLRNLNPACIGCNREKGPRTRKQFCSSYFE
jgi:5-methylcytosine-specific restriction endonuclease McrA